MGNMEADDRDDIFDGYGDFETPCVPPFPPSIEELATVTSEELPRDIFGIPNVSDIWD